VVAKGSTSDIDIVLIDVDLDIDLDHQLDGNYFEHHHLVIDNIYDIQQHIRNYSKRFVTIQEDGTEDDELAELAALEAAEEQEGER